MHSKVKRVFPLAATPFFPPLDCPSRLCILPLTVLHLCFLPVRTGGCWRSADLTKEMDILPEGQTGLSGAGVSTALHHSGHLPLV